MSITIDTVIPVFYPDRRFLDILEILAEQTVPLRRIHIINTEKEGLDRLLAQYGMTEASLLKHYPMLSVTHISRDEFDHGSTRNQGISYCEGADFVLMMTQDAMPESDDLVELLAAGLMEHEDMAAAYARQIPNRNATAAESYSRLFNYPEESGIKTEKDKEQLGIKTYFCSNVCAMYRLEALHALGGFPEPMIFNEDMVFAGYAMKAGWSIYYCAEARVYHSHDYSPLQQFHRNFDLGVSQHDHPEVFGGIQSEGEGVKYVKAVLLYLRKQNARREIPAFLAGCVFRFAGYRLGRIYSVLPGKLVAALSSNKAYWKKRQVMAAAGGGENEKDGT